MVNAQTCLQMCGSCFPVSSQLKPWLIHQDQARRPGRLTRRKIEPARLVQTSTQASSHILIVVALSARPRGCCPPSHDWCDRCDASLSLSTALDRLPACLERRPPPPRSSASLPSFLLEFWGWQRPGGLEYKQSRNYSESRLLALVNHLRKGLRGEY